MKLQTQSLASLCELFLLNRYFKRQLYHLYSMDFDSKIIQLRKDNDISRDDLAKAVGTSPAIIGRYERNEITPSVEVAAKIADALDVSLDYLVGASSFVVKDKKMLHRLELLEKIDTDDRDTILKVVDNYLTSAQLQTTQKKLKQKA
jgi:transcriptional regulator with XRE-family HTH domain